MTKIRALMGCVAIVIACGFANACAEGPAAGDVEGVGAPLQSASGAAGQAAPEAQSEEELLSSANNITYYDGCKKVHDPCRCQNTGWAGYCGVRLDFPDVIVLCVCN
jgi:hypothetical protein